MVGCITWSGGGNKSAGGGGPAAAGDGSFLNRALLLMVVKEEGQGGRWRCAVGLVVVLDLGGDGCRDMSAEEERNDKHDDTAQDDKKNVSKRELGSRGSGGGQGHRMGGGSGGLCGDDLACGVLCFPLCINNTLLFPLSTHVLFLIREHGGELRVVMTLVVCVWVCVCV